LIDADKRELITSSAGLPGEMDSKLPLFMVLSSFVHQGKFDLLALERFVEFLKTGKESNE